MQFHLAAQALPNLQSLVVFMSLLLVWSTLRPNMVRDYDNRRLPNHPTARLLYAFICVLAYVALVVFFQKFGDLARNVAESTMSGFVRQFVEANKDAAPLLAAVTIAALLQFSFFRDLERSLLVWLHSARHLQGDTIQLARHLERCQFVPNDDERELNRSEARRFGVYVTDNGLEGVNLVTFHSWRKVASLLRLLREWNTNERRVVSQNDMHIIDDIETAHERKTQLAMTIVKMVEQIERGGERTHALGELLALLTGTPHGDRARVEAVESRLKTVLETGGDDGASSAETGGADKPLRLTGRQFEAHLHEIEGYFKVEYDILLSQASSLVAKSVVLSGEEAPARLETLKQFGFHGLGRIRPINFDRILWLFMLIAFGGFLILVVGNVNAPTTPVYHRLARFSIVMAIAALIGAIIGSSQRYARALSTPWTTYFAAGIAAMAVNVAISEVWELASAYITEAAGTAGSATAAAAAPPAVTASAGGQVVPSPRMRTLAWSFVPAMVTIAVCWLGRLPAWPFTSHIEGGNRALAERFLDGLALSAAVLVGYYMAIGTHYLFDWQLPESVRRRMELPHILPIPLFLPLQIMSFFIGFFALRDVRRAAQSSIVDSRSARHHETSRTSVPATAAASTARIEPDKAESPRAEPAKVEPAISQPTRPDPVRAETARQRPAPPGSPLPV